MSFATRPPAVIESPGWQLAYAYYPALYGYVTNAYEATPEGVFFKTDGTKMYVVGASQDRLVEYSLNTAWDLTTVQVTRYVDLGYNAMGLFIRDDGAKLYIVDDASFDEKIREYNLNTPWDISTLAQQNTYVIRTQDTQPTGVFFKPDGTAMYMSGENNASIYQYSLATPWSLAAGSPSFIRSKAVNVTNGDLNPTGVCFKPDGLKMFFTGTNNRRVAEWTLSSAWDISTATASTVLSVATQDRSPEDLFIDSTGTRLFMIGALFQSVYRYNLGTAWTVSSATFVAPTSSYFSVSAQTTSPYGLTFGSNGTRMYLTSDGSSVFQYNLSVAWNVFTATSAATFSTASQDNTLRGIYFGGTTPGSKMYVVGSSNDRVYEYNLGTPWEISTATYLQQFSIAGQDTSPSGLYFSPDGLRMFVMGDANNTVYKYNLSSAWNISTAVSAQSASISLVGSTPRGVFFKDDGLIMYLLESTIEKAVQLPLSVAWDLTTLSVPVFPTGISVLPYDRDSTSIAFKSDGKKMYICGQDRDAVFEFNL